MYVVIWYALGYVLDFFFTSLGTWAAFHGEPMHSNEVEGVVASTDVLERVETIVIAPICFGHVEGDN